MAAAAGLVSGERHEDWPAFAESVARAAAGFAARGLGPGDCVALLLRNDFAFLHATAAAQRAGCYPVPINWHGSGDDVRYVLEDCGARVLIGHADLLAAIADDLPPDVALLSVPPPPEIVATYGPGAPAPARAEDWHAWLAAQDPARAPEPAAVRESVFYTSGTTGRPKGVRREPADAEQNERIDAMRRGVYGFRPQMRTVIAAPLYHAAPNSYALRSLRHAALIVLMPRFDAEALLALIATHRITHLFLVPTMFVRLLRLPPAVREQYDVSSLEWIIHAGAPCPPDVKRAMIAWLGPIVHEFYGSTEMGSVTYCDSADALRKPGTVGRPVAGATVRVLREDGMDAASGEAGEVFARVDCLPDFTYIGRPEARAEIEREGLITGGDVGYLDRDGYLFLCDRKRDMVIVGGVNVYPAEIEAALIAMPGVRDCAVFGVPDAEYGERLMAVVQPEPDAARDADAVRAFLAARLAPYKVPRTIEFRDALPREDSGKIFKRRLRDPYWRKAARAV
jgi:long-chain acyl-CoA synthetase